MSFEGITATDSVSLHQVPLDETLRRVCGRVAPSWPLDSLIAVNPFWGWVDTPFARAMSEVGRLAGRAPRTPLSFFRRAWSKGALRPSHIENALQHLNIKDSTADSILKFLDGKESPEDFVPLLSEVAARRRHSHPGPTYSETIIHNIGQVCAAYFDCSQADWHPSRERGLYRCWRDLVAGDVGLALLLGRADVQSRTVTLPDDHQELLQLFVSRLSVPYDRIEDLFTALLLRINGWAAWCAYMGWTARMAGADDASLVELLAIRCAWELLLDDGERGINSVWHQWRQLWLSQECETSQATSSPHHVLQRGLEIAYQQELSRQLVNSLERRADEWSAGSASQCAPEVQAVFCIDVRSEVFRRCLESVSPRIATLGFAGFFGLPISYTPPGASVARAQLPGLLSPSLRVLDRANDPQCAAVAKLERHQEEALAEFQRLPSSTFSYVELAGLSYIGKLLKRAFTPPFLKRGSPRPGNNFGPSRLQPILSPDVGTEERCALAGRVLRGMSLTEGFAPIVLLVGHGSQSSNNPHARGLDCGACCGQSGEVNARVLAGILNDAEVRKGLASQGIAVPETTRFVPALHNTTTDEVDLFDVEDAPPSLTETLLSVRSMLAAAGDSARRERAPLLGLEEGAYDNETLLDTFRSRAADWAQTRPEWGLANNAAFIAAPRRRTRGFNLCGRAFLHEYVPERDPSSAVLELIMTAPMIVAHWINMQYYASTVDNERFGSGNKVLHNVVGGTIGVFEGNGGDLRIGLSKQSLHDGARWVHTPLRLSVYIEAPAEAIDDVIARNAIVRDLICNEWIFLFRIDEEGKAIQLYQSGRWTRV